MIGKGGSGIQDGISNDAVPWSLIERCSHTELALAIRESSLVVKWMEARLSMRYSDHRREEATFSLDVASSNVSPSTDAWSEQTQLSHPALIFEASSSGRTAGFDPAYRGSNPCASAKFYVGER